MAATLEEIKRWIAEAQESGATHVIVKCDGFGDPTGDCCYPVFVSATEDVRERDAENLNRTMEVYSLTGKHSVEKQLNEYRARHYD